MGGTSHTKSPLDRHRHPTQAARLPYQHEIAACESATPCQVSPWTDSNVGSTFWRILSADEITAVVLHSEPSFHSALLESIVSLQSESGTSGSATGTMILIGGATETSLRKNSSARNCARTVSATNSTSPTGGTTPNPAGDVAGNDENRRKFAKRLFNTRSGLNLSGE